MNPQLTAFIRGAVQAGVAAAVLFMTGNLDATNTTELIAGLALAFTGGVIAFAGQYLREQSPAEGPRTSSFKRPSKLDWLPF